MDAQIGVARHLLHKLVDSHVETQFDPLTKSHAGFSWRREEIQSWIRWLRINKASRPVYAELATFMVHTGARISEVGLPQSSGQFGEIGIHENRVFKTPPKPMAQFESFIYRGRSSPCSVK
jgi:hypothetical protein